MHSVTYRIAVADLVDARSYVYNRLPLVRAIRLVPFALTLGSLLYGIYLALLRGWSAATGMTGWLLIGISLVVWMYIGDRLLLPGSARKQLARSISLREEIVATWSSEHITWETNHGQSRWPWSDFKRPSRRMPTLGSISDIIIPPTPTVLQRKPSLGP